MKRKPDTIDDYLTDYDARKRAALQKLRKQVRAIVPKAVECISYHLPAFRLNGQLLVAFGGAAHHCAFYPCSGAAVRVHAKELAGFDTGKGTIRFQPEKPLPVALVRKLVKYRIEENVLRGRRRAARKR
jgi:uncharacterized protein YdhG (YjbR/CyaY superfamily)